MRLSCGEPTCTSQLIVLLLKATEVSQDRGSFKAGLLKESWMGSPEFEIGGLDIGGLVCAGVASWLWL